MKKREDTRIYIIGHKDVPYGFWDDSLYTPIQVGNGEKFLKVRDNKGENISEWNSVYAENTGIWWIWKNLPKKVQVVGICQYRRRLSFEENFDFENLFEKYDAVYATPLHLYQTLYRQYSNCHNDEDIKFVEDIIKDLYPDYAEDFENAIYNNTKIYYSNGWVMKRKDFDRYCEWLFNIFEEFKKRRGFNSPEDVREYVRKNIEEGKHKNTRGLDYQMQLFGFLSERLMTVFALHNFKNIYEIPFVKMEKGI